jgi:GNAT superfamily N-acetyltransferase
MTGHDLLRRRLGEGAKLWALGRHSVEDGRWVAFSGANSLFYNMVFCHGEARGLIEASIADVNGTGVPGFISVAGAALGAVKGLVDDGWVCVGTQPFMCMSLGRQAHPGRGPLVRRLGPGEVALAQSIAAEALRLTEQEARLAVPADSAARSDVGLWGLELEQRVVSVAVASVVGPVAVLWVAATLSSEQRKGLGRRLLELVHLELASQGAEEVLLLSSPAGFGLYKSLGYSVVEHTQLWCRPRWAIV